MTRASIDVFANTNGMVLSSQSCAANNVRIARPHMRTLSQCRANARSAPTMNAMLRANKKPGNVSYQQVAIAERSYDRCGGLLLLTSHEGSARSPRGQCAIVPRRRL